MRGRRPVRAQPWADVAGVAAMRAEDVHRLVAARAAHPVGPVPRIGHPRNDYRRAKTAHRGYARGPGQGRSAANGQCPAAAPPRVFDYVSIVIIWHRRRVDVPAGVGVAQRVVEAVGVAVVAHWFFWCLHIRVGL